MWRVVLDNAVLTSALLNPHGPAARLLDYAYEGRLRVFASDRMLSLERRVLREPTLSSSHGLSAREVRAVVRDLPVLLCLVPDSVRGRPARGTMATELLECASSSHADFLVTSMNLSAHEVKQGGTQVVKADQLVRLVGHGM